MTVYADVLIVVNLFVNYALLLCSSMIVKNRISNLRLLLGALIGSLYGLVIFLPEIPRYFELPILLSRAYLPSTSLLYAFERSIGRLVFRVNSAMSV